MQKKSFGWKLEDRVHSWKLFEKQNVGNHKFEAKIYGSHPISSGKSLKELDQESDMVQEDGSVKCVLIGSGNTVISFTMGIDTRKIMGTLTTQSIEGKTVG